MFEKLLIVPMIMVNIDVKRKAFYACREVIPKLWLSTLRIGFEEIDPDIS